MTIPPGELSGGSAPGRRGPVNGRVLPFLESKPKRRMPSRRLTELAGRKRREGGRRHHESEDMSTAAIAARRALQQQRARVLYRRALRNILSYAVHRDIFYGEAQKMREKFEINKDVSNLETIDRLLYEGETRVEKFQHPDPYIVPWAPGGSKWARNPPVPPEIGVVLDFGREENH